MKKLVYILYILIISEFSVIAQSLSPISFNSGSITNEKNISFTASIGQIFIASNASAQQDLLSTSLNYKNVIEKNISHIKIYPNPTNNIIYFQKENKDINILYIYNGTGKLIKTLSIGALENGTINFSNFQRGIYFLNFSCTKSNAIFETIKLIKQ
ncbi:MAG: T9SS type A sorting domain-containing protein [Bacteroidales bacterium]|nr:T9SS type A sorting domain-containing protein [Bacteroidales bacterium]